MRHLISVFDLCFYIWNKKFGKRTLLETLSFTRSFLLEAASGLKQQFTPDSDDSDQ